MYTLKDYLSLKELSDVTVLTKPMDFYQVEINSVLTIEHPVENFVHEKELVFSTVSGCTESDDKFLSFIKDIYACHPSVLIVSFKPDSKPVPKCVIDFANEVNFPILRLPWHYRFSEFISLALEKIKAEKEKHIILYEDLQKKLLNFFLSGQSLENAAYLIASTFHASVLIYDKYQKLRASFCLDDKKTEKTSAKCVCEININDSTYGYIEVFDAQTPSQIPIVQNLLQQYLSLPLSLWFNKENVINLTSLTIKNDYIWKLANSTEDNMERVLQNGKNLGFSLDTPYVGIVFKATAKDESLKKHQHKQFISHMLTIENLILTQNKLDNFKLLITLREETFLLYIELADAASINHFLDKIDTILLHNYPEYKFFWGIGEIPPKPFDFSQQYKKASFALEQCINTNIPSRRLSYNESRISSLVYQTADNEHLKKQAYESLGKILETDNALGMNLLQTLTTYFKCNYNASLTARELHLHRQSLLYRLEKIEALSGCSLSSHDDLFLLEFYTRLLSKF